MLPGELGSVNVDMAEGWKGNLQSWLGTGISQLGETRRFAAWEKRRKDDPQNMILGGGGCQRGRVQTTKEGREEK